MSASAFVTLPHGSQQHFALYFHAAVLRLLGVVRDHVGSADSAHERYPYLTAYFEAMVSQGLSGESFEEAHAWWKRATLQWEQEATVSLPLSRLRAATGLEYDDLVLLAFVGLPDEDPRMAAVFDALQGGPATARITTPVLAAVWHLESFDPRLAVHRLQALGLLESSPEDRSTLRPCPATWNALRGGSIVGADWVRHCPIEDLPALDRVIVGETVRDACRNVPRALTCGAMAAVVIRGPQHNGRSTLACGLAREIGKGVIEVTGLSEPSDHRWRLSATLAHLLDAVLLVRIDLGPSDRWALPEGIGGTVPLFVTMGPSGGLVGSLVQRSITIWMSVPDRDTRLRLWATVLGGDGPTLPALRLTSGHIVRAAQLAQATQAVGEGPPLDTPALRTAVRSLERPGLDALARRVTPAGRWSRLAVSSHTLHDLTTLEARCRHREQLARCVGPAFDDLTTGVRALFKGPSGTGKTLAARTLAGALGMDLYRVDLSAIVNKYIGETEKNLERVFARAEELDVILLLDEGDALLTQRTSVQSSNDRYANLETNYLLQRLESFDGILVVTTNAADRIDSAFQRRMDVIVEFSPPDASERWTIWQMHLPDAHQVELELLHAVAQRCILTGGQIRNAALHASLLAVEAGEPVTSTHLEAAIEREYRSVGAMSPLRGRVGARQ